MERTSMVSDRADYAGDAADQLHAEFIQHRHVQHIL